MGKPWSDERHLKLAIKRMKEIKSGKATTRFLLGRVAEFRHKGIKYCFGVTHDSAELSAHKGKKDLFEIKIRGKRFEEFVKNISEWLQFPMEYVVYKKRQKK